MKERETWLDVVRGIAILLVIYSHIVGSDSDINAVFKTTRMPLFFFISGFFIYQVEYDLQYLWGKLKNRLTKQLYPTVIFFSLFVAICESFNFRLALDEYKAGYWFTYVAFMYFISIAPLLLLFSRLHLRNLYRVVVLLFLIVLSMALCSLMGRKGMLDSEMSHFLSLEHYLVHLKSVLWGCVFRIFWNKYNERLMRWPLFVLSLLGFILCYIVKGHLSWIISFWGIYIVLYAVYELSRYHGDSMVFRWLSYLGSVTLEIYLLHYFMISLVFDRFKIFEDIKVVLVNTPYELPVYILMSIAVALVCLLIMKLLKNIKLYKVLFLK